MFDLAWSEMAVIGIIALVVVPPKDLPKVLRTVGAAIRRARGLAQEFQNTLDEMVREAELEEFRKTMAETQRHIESAGRFALEPAPKGYGDSGPAPEPGLPLPPPEDRTPADADENQLDLPLRPPAPLLAPIDVRADEPMLPFEAPRTVYDGHPPPP